MGYDIHVTHGDWWDKGARRISEGEWRAMLGDDDELQLVGQITAESPKGETITYSNPLLAILTGQLRANVTTDDVGTSGHSARTGREDVGEGFWFLGSTWLLVVVCKVQGASGFWSDSVTG